MRGGRVTRPASSPSPTTSGERARGPSACGPRRQPWWGVTANHPRPAGVKSYPNIGYSPKKLISSINTYTSSFDITVPGNVGSWEAAYDMWVKAPTGNTRIELMCGCTPTRRGRSRSVVARRSPQSAIISGPSTMAATGAMPRFRWSTPARRRARRQRHIGHHRRQGHPGLAHRHNTTQYGKFDNTCTDQVQWGFEISGDGG